MERLGAGGADGAPWTWRLHILADITGAGEALAPAVSLPVCMLRRRCPGTREKSPVSCTDPLALHLPGSGRCPRRCTPSPSCPSPNPVSAQAQRGLGQKGRDAHWGGSPPGGRQRGAAAPPSAKSLLSVDTPPSHLQSPGPPIQRMTASLDPQPPTARISISSHLASVFCVLQLLTPPRC